MKTFVKTAAAAALIGAFALPMSNATAGWGPWGNSGWGEGWGDMFGDFDFSASGHGWGRGYGDYYGYGGPYGYPGYGYPGYGYGGPYGRAYGAPYGGPYGAPYGAAPQQQRPAPQQQGGSQQ